jgi:hypothetical protein
MTKIFINEDYIIMFLGNGVTFEFYMTIKEKICYNSR